MSPIFKFILIATALCTEVHAQDSSIYGQARQLLEAGMSNPQALAMVMPNEDPKLKSSLRDSIGKVTELINNYRQNGLSSMAQLPQLPGLQSVMRVPDKLLRAELSMLQDEIRMAQDMMQNPISATMNTPKGE